MNHCMLDLETLGTGAGSVIVSLGAVVFNDKGHQAELYRNVRIDSCLKAGLVVDEGALQFWLTETHEDARKALFVNSRDLTEVLRDFQTFWGMGRCKYLWSHGATFDIPILGEAYRHTGMLPPWVYRFTRDTRTLFALSGVRPVQGRDPRTMHHALKDAVAQQEDVLRAYDALVYSKLES